MFELDIRTFLIIVEVLMVVYTLTTFFVYYIRRHNMHLLMGFALICSLLAFIVLHMSLDAPSVPIVVIYNVLFQCAMMLIIGGFRAYYRMGSFSYRFLIYLLISGLLIWVFTQMIPSYLGRISVMTFFSILFIADGLYDTRAVINNETKSVKRSILVVMCLLIFVLTFRWIFVFINNFQNDFAQNMISSSYNSGFFIIFIFNFWITGSLLLDSNSMVTHLKSKTKSMESLAMLDPLTKLNNRTRLEIDMVDYIELGNRQGLEVSLLLVDLDHFKEINDQFGHDVGDQVLTTTAKIISSTLRLDDRIYRWGGDEFLILAPQTDLLGASRLAQRILDQLSTVQLLEIKKLSASIGCAQHFLHETKEDWFKRVDLTLYKAKQAGRNRFEAWPNSEALPITIAKLVWNDSLNSGVEDLDVQHKGLVNLSNELYNRLISSESVSSLDQILDQVLVDLRDHFIYESDLMKKKGFPLLEEHMKIHEKLVIEYDQLRLQLKTGETNLAAFFNFVSVKIVAEHIVKEDTKFFEFNKTLRG
ncbi:MAG: diguanylate cyclase with hemerythrin-like metal-binding domain-containing protein [Erysipelotrichaceae bacterium]|nr:MAG: diguanylate cyclase with hemerythrin-like metal-binding domain-containing [Erysipelotrichaceae bacterium]TXT19922.1 MAG: diguanylate cyclase with hemerythrin-like metal-binding domain-containing protein [Erysipelotrichaceae bacterium]